MNGWVLIVAVAPAAMAPAAVRWEAVHAGGGGVGVRQIASAHRRGPAEAVAVAVGVPDLAGELARVGVVAIVGTDRHAVAVQVESLVDRAIAIVIHPVADLRCAGFDCEPLVVAVDAVERPSRSGASPERRTEGEAVEIGVDWRTSHRQALVNPAVPVVIPAVADLGLQGAGDLDQRPSALPLHSDARRRQHRLGHIGEGSEARAVEE